MYGSQRISRYHHAGTANATGLRPQSSPAAPRLMRLVPDVDHADIEPRTGLSPAIVALPEVAARRQSLRTGAQIFDRDTPADDVYFIHRGQVRLYVVNADRASVADADLENDPQGLRLAAMLRPGQWFGEAALAGLPNQGLRAVVHADAVISAINAATLRTVLARQPEQLLALLTDTLRQQHAVQHDAASLVFDDCNRRLVRALLRLSASSAATPGEETEVKLRITHMQLAQYIGVARETVSLALGTFRRKGLLRTGRNQVTFDPTKLAAAHGMAR